LQEILPLGAENSVKGSSKRVDLPVAQHLANKSTLLYEEWQFVNDISRKAYEVFRNLNGPNQNPRER
jgi:hypothetical protein